jgi:mannobiose 2-epimerase
MTNRQLSQAHLQSEDANGAAPNFATNVEAHLIGHILPFWCGSALDAEQGGWMAWLSNELKPDRSQPKGLIVNSRILWSFSAVYQARPEKQFQAMAKRAYEIVFSRFWDARYGGAFWRLSGDGRAIDDAKKTYGQAFYIYAIAEYYRAFGKAAALQRAITLFEMIEAKARDESQGGYWEVRLRNWTDAPGARLSDKDMAEKKSMNTHLHLLEAYTNLFRVWKSVTLEQRLRELIELFEQRILDRGTFHLNHFFDEAWNVRSDTYTFGHDIEASWLLCEAAEALGDEQYIKRQRALALRIAETVLHEGVDADGGLRYEGKAGEIVDAGKESWPQTEALVGFLNAFQISGRQEFYEAARRIWNFIDQHLTDRVYGEWFWRINPDGKPDPALPKVSEWKGPYHGTRACLQAIQRLRLK